MAIDTQNEERAKLISWYRTPIDPVVMKQLYQRSDLLGLAQTLGYLGLLVFLGGMIFDLVHHWHWWVTLALFIVFGTCNAFQINAVHEIGHETVFKTKALTKIFVHIFAFQGWINHYMFEASHVRHHRSTLHQPDDLEVVLPIKFTVKDFFLNSFVSPLGVKFVLQNTWRIATNGFQGEWELKLFPPDKPEKRRAAILWARILLGGHAAILLVSIIFWRTLWPLPLLTTFSIFYGAWLLFLCNNTQHVGLKDDTDDFRLCCRTFVPNPFVRFLYWHMNYHTEHHMYVGVPCYNLPRLHKLIKDDLPPTAHGLAAVWRDIAAILKKQKEDPTYQYDPQLPRRTTPAGAERAQLESEPEPAAV